MDAGAEWQAYLADKTGQRTVPMIFIHEKFIGGTSLLHLASGSGSRGEREKDPIRYGGKGGDGHDYLDRSETMMTILIACEYR